MTEKVFYGAAGIPEHGKEVEYATELWLENPKAFWCHPEGPLSETTPEEWRIKQARKEALRGRAQPEHSALFLNRPIPDANSALWQQSGTLSLADYNRMASMQQNANFGHGLRGGFR